MQLDFAVDENLVEYRRLLHRMVGEEPILYSLLGNTMANFDDDIELLRTADLAAAAAGPVPAGGGHHRGARRGPRRPAAEEYHSSRAYKEFVTSALQHYTDLTIDMDSVQFRGSVEADRALQVKVIYQNRTGDVQRIMLPDRNMVRFDGRRHHPPVPHQEVRAHAASTACSRRSA